MLWMGGSFLCAEAQGVADSTNQIPKEITDAFKVGNSRILRTWLSNRTLLSFNGKSKLYSPSQAQKLLKTFFSEHPPMSFEPIHQGFSEKETGKNQAPLLYYIAMYHSEKTYRMYMLVKRYNKGHRIRSIFLDEE